MRRPFNERLLMLLFVLVSLGNVEATAAELKPGTTFKDCEHCPEMIVIPAGTFLMGSPADEVGRQDDEGPQHVVTIVRPFAIGRHHVLAGEWDEFVKQTGIRIKDGDVRPGRECKAGKPRYPQSPEQPAVCMNHKEVQAYLDWISSKTGKHYRLLSEAEFEYAARAGSTGAFPFPFDEPDLYAINRHANTYGDLDGYRYTSPAGAFAPNAFGVYDMHGNVSDRVADCWHENYVGAPTDGSAWIEPDCALKRMRGNDWIEAPVWSRSANRNDTDDLTTGDWLGFRLALDLPKPAPSPARKH